jgi:hypothetical protein
MLPLCSHITEAFSIYMYMARQAILATKKTHSQIASGSFTYYYLHFDLCLNYINRRKPS